jgi:prepilin-type processing-associated H-X9-DG protein
MKACRYLSWGLLVSIPAVALSVAAVVPAAWRAREEARRVHCRSNLNVIAKGLATYLDQYGDRRFYPPRLGVLYDTGIIPEQGVFVCPSDRDPPKLPGGLPCSYVYRAPKPTGDDFPPNDPVVWERKAFHGEGRSVVFADSHVEFRTQLEEELQAQQQRNPSPKGEKP